MSDLRISCKTHKNTRNFFFSRTLPTEKRTAEAVLFDLRSLAFLNEIVDHVHDTGSDEGQKGA